MIGLGAIAFGRMEEEEEEVGDGIEKHLTSLSGSTESVPSDQAVKEDLIEDASRTVNSLLFHEISSLGLSVADQCKASS